LILDEIVSSKKNALELKKQKYTIDSIVNELSRKNTDAYKRNFKEALLKEGLSVIGEIKKASPSKGVIVSKFDPAIIAEMYEKIDVDAISVLTEQNYFKGKDEYIGLVKNIVSKPVLRKDFIVDEYQIYESKLIGADAILLIVRILGKNLKKFYKLAYSLGMQCIVEVHNSEELDEALNAGVEIIGINNRNLENFTINLETTAKLIKYIPRDTVIISESGINSKNDFKYIRDLDINAVLIGEGFMRKVDDINNMKKFLYDIKY
jgi:indole-3-glycerol phosphate synthase